MTGRKMFPMLRYRLRTLLILLAILPPLLWIGWGKYQAWRAVEERRRVYEYAVGYLRLSPADRDAVLKQLEAEDTASGGGPSWQESAP